MSDLPPIEHIEMGLDWAKAVWVPIITAILSSIVTYAIQRRQINAEARVNEGKQQAEDRVYRASADALQTDAMTHRFQALMDGYEQRIQDLTNEVRQLRNELVNERRIIQRMTDEMRRLRDEVEKYREELDVARKGVNGAAAT